MEVRRSWLKVRYGGQSALRYIVFVDYLKTSELVLYFRINKDIQIMYVYVCSNDFSTATLT